jgi:hypothetical protein
MQIRYMRVPVFVFSCQWSIPWQMNPQGGEVGCDDSEHHCSKGGHLSAVVLLVLNLIHHLLESDENALGVAQEAV